jgi:hypothetical protein
MNDTTRLDVRPEVATFVARVRVHLSDLSEEEREELVGGLDADLTELVADGGSVEALGDPAAYSAELRAAAGLGNRRAGLLQAVRRPHRPVRERVAGLLDAARGRWDASMAARAWVALTWDVVARLSPAWWLLRGWLAAQIIDVISGPWEFATLVPRLGNPVAGWLVLVGAVAVSVLIGVGKVWPGSRARSASSARVALLAVNVCGVLLLAPVMSAFPSAWILNDAIYGGQPGSWSRPGLVNDGRVVRNVFAYDTEGEPITGVQLYDQAGRPLAVDPDAFGKVRTGTGPGLVYPWLNGNQELWNVFPLPVREQRSWSRRADVWTTPRPPVLLQPPLAVVPPAALPTPGAD